jgi:hypothetical protein
MQDRTDPARVLREAWSVVRLNSIRDFVSETIDRLRELSPQQLLGRTVAEAGDRFDMNPMGQAWQACCDELCAESGVPDPQHLRSAHRDSIVRRLAAEPEWAAAYHEALEKYRNAAAHDLRAWLDAFPPIHGR